MSDATNTAAPPRPTPNLSGAERAKKLTMTRVCGRLPPMTKGQGKVWHADFYCYVTGKKEEDSEFGEYNRWLGEFRAINVTTGEVLVSANAIFPPIASDLIEAAYSGANKGQHADNVMLAFRIGTEPDYLENGMPANKTGYRYIIQDIIAASNKSPLDMLYESANTSLIEGKVEEVKQIASDGDTPSSQDVGETSDTTSRRGGRSKAA